MLQFERDFWREECGVFGIHATEEEVSRHTFFGLFALQHRGQESAGIAVSNGEDIFIKKGMGLAQHVFDEAALAELHGMCAVGHVRYSTTGSSLLENAQPILADSNSGPVALGHNGNLVNAIELRQELEKDGHVFESTSDSEVIAKLISSLMHLGLEGALEAAMSRLKGAYSVVAVHNDKLIGMRDPLGFRPLCLGKLNNEHYILASESCALFGAEFVREIQPGEIVIIEHNNVKSSISTKIEKNAFCIFEFVYLARPDSHLFGKSLYLARRRMGHLLAQEHPAEADLVIPIPDTGFPAAIGYSEASRIPFGEGLIKNRYIHRTFIQPDQRMRDLGVRMKLSPVSQSLAGMRVVMVDDSIVRGTTTGPLVGLLRDAGAREVHVRISSPPIKYPCYYGIDTAIQDELIAHKMPVKQICEEIGADSLGYLSMAGLIRATELPRSQFCLACFNGRYPIGLPKGIKVHKSIFEKPTLEPAKSEASMNFDES